MKPAREVTLKKERKKPEGEHMHLKDEEERAKVMKGRDRACK